MFRNFLWKVFSSWGLIYLVVIILFCNLIVILKLLNLFFKRRLTLVETVCWPVVIPDVSNCFLNFIIKSFEWTQPCFSINQVFELRNRMTIGNSTTNFIFYETKSEERPPAMKLNIIPKKTVTRIYFMASDNFWWKNTSIRNYDVKFDIAHGGEWLHRIISITSTLWIDHASWTPTTGLLLLLRTSVDIPPNRIVNFYVSVFDIRNFST